MYSCIFNPVVLLAASQAALYYSVRVSNRGFSYFHSVLQPFSQYAMGYLDGSHSSKREVSAKKKEVLKRLGHGDLVLDEHESVSLLFKLMQLLIQRLRNHSQ